MDHAAPGPPAQSGPPEAPPFSPGYDGALGDVAGIALANGLFGILTLGFYRFWGKTRLRRYLWSHVSFRGDPLEYTGRGAELLLGFLIAIVILLPLGFAASAVELAFASNETAVGVSNGIKVLVVLFLVDVAIFRARRYRLTRTQWRGIRGGQSGSAVRYALMALGWSFVTVITLGLAYPVLRTRLQRFRMDHTWFGDRRLAFDGRAARLIGPWLLAWLLIVPTLGLMYLWYRAYEFRYFAAHTRYGALGFRSDLRASRVIWIGIRYLVVVGMIISVIGGLALLAVPGILVAFQTVSSGDEATVSGFSPLLTLAPFGVLILIFVALGVARAAVFVHPLLRELCRSLAITGEEDFEAILQSRRTPPRRGEGLADALDVGSI